MNEQPYNQIVLTEEQFARFLETAGNSDNPHNNKQQNTLKTSGLIKPQIFSETSNEDLSTWLFLFTNWRIASGINQDRQLIAMATKKRLREKIHYLRQTSSVVIYSEEFMNLYTAIGSMTEEEAVDRFIRNLKGHVRASVLVHNPQELLVAMRIAESYDTASSRPNYHKWPPPQHNRFQNNHPPQEDKMEVDSVDIRNQQLSQQTWKRKGEVLEADIMLPSKIEDAIDNNNHEHHFMDLQTPTPPLLLNVEINDRKHLALIDSSATTEIISSYLVTKERLDTEKLKTPIRITVADGKTYEISEVCTMPVTIKGKPFEITALVFEHSKHSLILGRSWLKKNNPSIDWRIPSICLNSIQTFEIKNHEDPNLIAYRSFFKQFINGYDTFAIKIEKHKDKTILGNEDEFDEMIRYTNNPEIAEILK
ncbi:hypothetical protein BB560_004981, partial [Smittium megazygosporum]